MPPKLTKDLEDVTVTEGSECTLVVTVDGNPNPTIEWYIIEYNF